jgi:ABC-type sulfate transport system substrate-binding protein
MIAEITKNQTREIVIILNGTQLQDNTCALLSYGRNAKFFLSIHPMQNITVKRINGQTLTIEVRKGASGRQIKEAVEVQTRIPADQLTIMVELGDDETIGPAADEIFATF